MSLTHVVDIPVKNWILARSFKPGRYAATSIFQPFATDQDDVMLIKWDEANRSAKIFELQSNGETESVTVKYEYTTDNVKAKVISIRAFISTKDLRNATDPILNAHEKGIVNNLMRNLMVYRENDAVSLAQNGSNYGVNTEALLSGSQWSDSGSTPYEDMARWAEIVSIGSEEDTNFIFIAKDVFKILANHQDTIDRLPTIKEKVLTPEGLQKLLTNQVDLKPDQIVIGKSTYNASKTDTKDQRYFWSKSVIMAYQNPDAKNMLLQQTFGQMFYPKGYDAVKIFKYTKDELRGGYFIEVELAYTFKIVSKDCGFLGTAVIA